MSKLNQNKDKSPAFASCHDPAWTVCPGTLRVAWAAFDGRNREWVWSQAKKVTCRLSQERMGMAWVSMRLPERR